jgi:hypothetical protein
MRSSVSGSGHSIQCSASGSASQISCRADSSSNRQWQSTISAHGPDRVPDGGRAFEPLREPVAIVRRRARRPDVVERRDLDRVESGCQRIARVARERLGRSNAVRRLMFA